MSEAWPISDDFEPKKEWGRDKRVELVSEALRGLGVEGGKILLGGERFEFQYKDRYIVLDMHQRSHGRGNVTAHIFLDEERWQRFSQADIKGAGERRNIDKHIEKGNPTEEDFRDAVLAALEEI